MSAPTADTRRHHRRRLQSIHFDHHSRLNHHFGLYPIHTLYYTLSIPHRYPLVLYCIVLYLTVSTATVSNSSRVGRVVERVERGKYERGKERKRHPRRLQVYSLGRKEGEAPLLATAMLGDCPFPSTDRKRGITRPPVIWNDRVTPRRAHGVKNRPCLTSLGNRIAVYGSGARARSIVAPVSLRFNGSSEYTRLAIRAHSGTLPRAWFFTSLRLSD